MEELWREYRTMARWKISPSALMILATVVAIMLLIVVLPDVDLLDTAFHRGTAPVLVHARATSAPAMTAVAAIFQALHSPSLFQSARKHRAFDARLTPNFRPIYLRSIRC